MRAYRARGLAARARAQVEPDGVGLALVRARGGELESELESPFGDRQLEKRRGDACAGRAGADGRLTTWITRPSRLCVIRERFIRRR